MASNIMNHSKNY